MRRGVNKNECNIEVYDWKQRVCKLVYDDCT